MNSSPVAKKQNRGKLIRMHPNKAGEVRKIVPGLATKYPDLRYMGSKKRLLIWIHQVLETLDFESALDPFSGTGCVSYPGLFSSSGMRGALSQYESERRFVV